MKPYQLAGIGNAIVDVITRVSDHELSTLQIDKGVMQLIDQQQAEWLLAKMPERAQSAGGSVANTLVGASQLGLRTAFVGRVQDDALGQFCVADTTQAGTDFVNDPVAMGLLPTSRCLIFVTPDGERSMNTYLGISAELGPDDVNEAILAGSEWALLEGYLYDKDAGKAAFKKAAQACQSTGGQVGITLSDPFCVDRHRNDFQNLVRTHMNFAIGNSAEWCTLYNTTDLTVALQQAAQDCTLVACTRSGDSVLLLQGGQTIEVPVAKTTPIDATGAGDQFAAGLLSGLALGQSLPQAGAMGCLAAAEVIQHVGARPLSQVRAQIVAAGLWPHQLQP